MPSYKHQKLVETIAVLDTRPLDDAEYAAWLEGTDHLDLLRDNAQDDELIIYASGPETYIYTAVISEDSLAGLTREDLRWWGGLPESPLAGYTYSPGSPRVWIERNDGSPKQAHGIDAKQIVFRRHFERFSGEGSAYFEILQEFAHLADIHWRSEEGAYCRYDELGEIEHVVSTTLRNRNQEVSMVSLKRGPLEEYLASSDSVLIRKFDFTVTSGYEFTGWPEGAESQYCESDMFYWQKLDAGKSAWTVAVQVIRPSRSKTEIFAEIQESTTSKSSKYVEFEAQDLPGGPLRMVSTDPSKTRTYFDNGESSLPHELSPAFFRPEVLQKYKSDRDKYTIDEELRLIRCRGSWALRTYDVNEAGQVHTYVRYLRELPYVEQLYWKSFNEEPKGGISERAYTNDFLGKPYDNYPPLLKIKRKLTSWSSAEVDWWKMVDSGQPDRVNVPRTNSRDEWSGSFLNLAKLVVEGFRVKPLRKVLRDSEIQYSKEERSLALLERILIGQGAFEDGDRLDGLRTVQRLRTESAAHVSSGGGLDSAKSVLDEHGTFTAHFESVCEDVCQELDLIESVLSVTAK